MSTGVADVKEVTMDVGGGSVTETPALEGGGSRARTRRRRRTRVAQEGGAAVAVEKADGHVVVAAPTPVPVPVPAPVAAQKGGAVKPRSALKAAEPAAAVVAAPTKVVIAPPKKRAPKLLFVPKNKVASPMRAAAAKTFKARRVSVTIDNTAKTQKRRRQTVQKVEGMSDDQLRAAAVAAKLSRRETVEKVPADLLRQMLKDYYMMRGMLV